MIRLYTTLIRTSSLGIFLSAFFLLSLVTFLPSQAIDETQKLLNRGNEFLDGHHYDKAIDIYNKLLSIDAHHVEALSKGSLAYAKQGYFEGELQKRFYHKSLKMARKAYRLDRNNTWTNHAMAVALGRNMEDDGWKSKINKIKRIKKFNDRTLSLDKTIAGAWFIEGLYQYKLANLNYFKRTIAKTLLGAEEVKSASFRKARKAFSSALVHDEKKAVYYLYLGKVNRKLDQDEIAKEILNSALTLDPSVPGNKDKINECRRIVDRI